MANPKKTRSFKALLTVGLLAIFNALLPDWLANKLGEYLRLRDEAQEASVHKSEGPHVDHELNFVESAARRVVAVAAAFVFSTFAPFFMPLQYVILGFVLILFLPGLLIDFINTKRKAQLLKSPYFWVELLSGIFLLLWMERKQVIPLVVALEGLNGEARSFPLLLILIPLFGRVGGKLPKASRPRRSL